MIIRASITCALVCLMGCYSAYGVRPSRIKKEPSLNHHDLPRCTPYPRVMTPHRPSASAEERHDGVDFRVFEGEVIIAVAPGVVEVVVPSLEEYKGGLLQILHDPKDQQYISLMYAHLDRIRVRTGQRVSAGTVLGDAWRPADPRRRWTPHV